MISILVRLVFYYVSACCCIGNLGCGRGTMRVPVQILRVALGRKYVVEDAGG